VDAHCHIGIRRGPVPIESLDEARELARTDRDTGVLAIRDAGSPYPYPELVGEEDLPRLIRAGHHIAASRRYLRGIGLECEPHEAVAALARQAKLGDGWVKLVGDWIDRSEGDLAPLWPGDALRAAVERAHAAGVRVAVHTFGEEALPDLIDAGVDSIEHGTGLTEDLVARLAQTGAALVPTLINIDNFPGIAESARAKFPVYADRMDRLHGTARARVRAAYEAGVPIYCGTDAGGWVHHGRVVDEILALHEAGLPAEAALAAGSWAARRWLGHPGLEEGAPADFIVLEHDPRADLGALRTPTRIVLRGAILR
jgi:imidazolonepropionase-like amidohydrolase